MQDAAGIRLVQDAFNTISMPLYAGLGFDVPDEVVAHLGGGRPRVLVSVNGYSFRAEISRTPRGYWLGLSPWRRAAGRIAAGRWHEVVVELDLPLVARLRG